MVLFGIAEEDDDWWWKAVEGVVDGALDNLIEHAVEGVVDGALDNLIEHEGQGMGGGDGGGGIESGGDSEAVIKIWGDCFEDEGDVSSQVREALKESKLLRNKINNEVTRSSNAVRRLARILVFCFGFHMATLGASTVVGANWECPWCHLPLSRAALFLFLSPYPFIYCLRDLLRSQQLGLRLQWEAAVVMEQGIALGIDVRDHLDIWPRGTDTFQRAEVPRDYAYLCAIMFWLFLLLLDVNLVLECFKRCSI
ncbi:hypothetical protein LguiB_023140 [Lonicera macranthoides]